MKGLVFTKGLILLVILLAIALVTGCAGSREQGNATDNEDFSSLSDTTGTEQSRGQSDEDEVLRLLGLSTSEETPTTANESATGTQDEGDLEARIETLERNINEKNLQVANLKAELAERDRRIQDLKSEKSTTVTSYGSTPATPMAPSKSFKERYNNALDLYYNRQYRQALREFDALLAMSGSQNLMDNCQYWKGECYYGLNEFHQAIIEFEKVFIYSNSNKYDDTQLKLGLCYLKLGNREKARVEFQKLLDNYPDSEYIPKANQYLAGL
jgi:TolA-binding protein